MEKNTITYFNEDLVKDSLTNTQQILFEVTDQCNLNCTYCGYGSLYSNHDQRENKMLSFDKAKPVIDYMNDLWSSYYNKSYFKNVSIGFYGGEPLLNMKFITAIVEYVKKMNCPTRQFTFSMTTNALLLHRYMDYVAANKFNLLISLDGNKDHMFYRKDKSGRNSFNRIVKNIDLLKESYPEYFRNYVDFNAVLHNKNSVKEIYDFFKEKYNVIPRISGLGTVGIDEDKKEEFIRLFKNFNEDLFQSENYEIIMKDMFFNIDIIKQIGIYLKQHSDFIYSDYNELLYGKQQYAEPAIPSGTCMPFSRKIYMTVNGKLLPCERIGQQFALGSVDEKGVHIDFQSIADKYNAYYTKLDQQCKTCCNKKSCSLCIFNIKDIDNNAICEEHTDAKNFELYKNAVLGFLSENPEEYERLIEGVSNLR